jgi:hypothetical protein
MVFMYHGAELVKKSSFHGPSGTRMLYQKTLTPPAFFSTIMGPPLMKYSNAIIKFVRFKIVVFLNHLRPSNPQLTPPTLQIQYCYSLINCH